MRILKFGILAAVVFALTGPVVAGEITDASGRKITIAEPVTRIAAAGPPAEILLYAFAPDAMLGWVRGVSPKLAPFITPEAKALPTLGAVTAQGDSPEIPGILAAKPQMILDFGDIDARYIALAGKTQERTGVPYVLLDGALAKTPAVLRDLGKLTGRTQRAEELAAYAEGMLARAQKAAAGKKPIKVYIARSADGTDSTMAGSHAGDVYDLAGLRNVAEYRDATPPQVQMWDPDVIVTLDPKFLETAKGAPWAGVRAVKDGRIVLVPRPAWGLTDHPPSLNRLIGVLWLTSKLYGAPTLPELREEAKRFHKTFFHVDLTEEQVTAMLGGP